jgi:hypothetical protein
MVASDGGLFRFGTNSPFYGSAVNACPGAPAVAVATSRGAVGYWIAFADARTYAFSPASAAPKCNRSAGTNTPGPGNTGVRAGTALSPYGGPMTITRCGVVIDRKIITGDLTIRASNGTHSASTPCVKIQNSLVRGTVDDSYASKGMGPLVLRDTEIAVPTPNDGAQIALTEANIYAWRINVHGGRTNVMCDGSCEIHDSWIHGNYYVSPNHLGGFLSNGNSGRPILLDHNTIECSIINASQVDNSSGCSAALALFGDFSSISHITVTNNVFRASHDTFYYCAYTGARQPAKPYPVGTNLVWIGNIFERGPSGRCGDAGATADWAAQSGNVWTKNIWSDGRPVAP